MSARAITAGENAATPERRAGQSLVELALALPVLLLLLLGTIDLGRVFFDYIEIRNAAREGAGYGARFPADTTGIALRVTRHGVPAGASVTSTCTGCETSEGQAVGNGTIAVTVASEFSPITLGFLEAWFDMDPIQLSATASMRVLQ